MAQSSDDSTTDESNFYVYTLPTWRTEALADGDDFTGIDTNIEFAPTGWFLPPNNNVAVAIFQRSASHQLADTFEITATYLPNWRNYNSE